ncbi:MAG: iron-containing alcohol dehydrogenase [Candidatus Helarchaeota archaeon]|nr:iron-containing alcohol dehydrogenase [Candidatus Helarchaeota archaeon]
MSEEEMKTAWYEKTGQKETMGMMSGRAIRGIMCNINGNIVLGGKVGLLMAAVRLSMQLKDVDKNLLIITDSFTEKFSPNVIGTFKIAGFTCKVWNGAQPELPISTIEEGRQVCEEFKPTVLLAIGGGSVMDSGKAIWIQYENPDIEFTKLDPTTSILGLGQKIKRYIAIPTTSGTGSEATAVSVVTDTRRTPPMKIPVVNYETVPDIVILDTDFVKDMPPFLTMATGLDAFAHSIGAYICNWSTPFTDAMNEVAIKEIIKYLGRAVKYGAKDLEAREHMQWAAYYAGLGFGNSMAGIDHALGHSLGAVFHVHHGLAVGLFAPQSIAYQAKVTDRWKGLCPLFGIDPKKNVSRKNLLDELLDAVKGYITSIGGITAVKDCKNPEIDEESYKKELDILTKYAVTDIDALVSNRPVTYDEFKKIYEFAWEGKELFF